MFALFCHVFGRFDKMIRQRPKIDVIWGLMDLLKTEIVLSGRTDDIVVSDDLNPDVRSLLNILAKNLT
jgi:hypothetical protein